MVFMSSMRKEMNGFPSGRNKILNPTFVLLCIWLILFQSISLGDTMQPPTLSAGQEEFLNTFLLGNNAFSQNNLLQAKEHYLKALEAWKKLAEVEKMFYKQQIKTIHISLGLIDTQLKRFPEALESYGRVVEIGDESDKALANMLMGSIYKVMGSYMDAKQCLQQSAEIYKKIADKLTNEDRLNLAQVYFELASCKFAAHDYEGAKEDQNEAFKIFEELNYPSEVKIQTYGSVGQTLLDMGEYDQALGQFRKALEVATEEVKDNAEVILDCHLNLSFAYDALGELQKVKEELNKTEKYFDKITFKNKEDKVKYLVKMWNRVSSLGYGEWKYLVEDWKTKYLEKAIELCEEDEDLKTSTEFADALKARGNFRLTRKRFKEAEEDLTAAVRIFKNKGSLRMEVNTLLDLTQVYMEDGNFQKAVEILKAAKEPLRQKGAVDIIASVNMQIALALYNSCNFEEALKVLEEDEVTTSQMWWHKWIRYLALGGVLEKKGRLDDAYKNFAKAIELIEGLRQTIKLEETRTGFVGDKTIAYRKIVEVLYRMGRFEDALEYADRAKCRILVEQLALARLRRPEELESTALGKKLAKEEDELFDNIRLILSQTRSSNISLPTEKEKRLSEVWTRMEEEFKGNNSVLEYLSLRRGDAVKVKELTEIIQRRFSDAALVEYFPGKYNGKNGVFIFVMGSKDGRVKAEFVPVSVEEYMESLEEISNKRSFTGRSKNWRELGEYLIKPIREHIKGYKVLCIVPYGDLSRIPMHALYTEGSHCLVEMHAVVYCPAASILKYIIGREGGGKGVLIISNPTENKKISLSEYEGTKIAGLFRNKGYVVEAYAGKMVTKDFIQTKWADRDIIHLACHGMFDKDKTFESSVEFADGDLKAKEIYDQTLQSNLVVLSACETAKSTEKAGEPYGLPRAFLYAGASSLMCTLWKVDDLSTTMLLEKFYEKLLSATPGTINKAEALRQAQEFLLKVSRGEVEGYLKKAEERGTVLPEDVEKETYEKINKSKHPFEDPYYWAPFILIGDWCGGI